ncbi:hypothetical protein NDU88_006411 [Pleurodeles waltl]|uniref:Uncharacterized protein n=1 Tax=Pleurodeles waltl TaxID=8319 RepID=A0AAV7N0V4_PLEWA|nr:hypothetical protein NDU88_006411 [Pleurodeles waltl]
MPRVASLGCGPPYPVPPRPTAATSTRPAAPSRALVGSTPCLHLRGRSAQHEPQPPRPQRSSRPAALQDSERPSGCSFALRVFLTLPDSGGALTDVGPGPLDTCRGPGRRSSWTCVCSRRHLSHAPFLGHLKAPPILLRPSLREAHTTPPGRLS